MPAKSTSNETGDRLAAQFRPDEAYLRQEFSRIAAAAARGERRRETSRLQARLAREAPHAEEPLAARIEVAASTAILPITPEMAWAVPQLLKRIQLVAPGVVSTSGVLRSLIRMPQWDEQFAKAFADSGFLSCDQAFERVHWKYDLTQMMANRQDGSAWQVLEHCRALLAQHRTKQPLDWDGVVVELETLNSWFPQLHTIQLLEQLYGRLQMLHTKSLVVAQRWLDWRAGLPEAVQPQGACHA